MRLYGKDDAILGIVLIFSAVIVFQQPLRFALEIAHDVEARYHLDLIPALTVLAAVFAFHEHKKRLQARQDKVALLAEMGQERARSGELERCILLSQALADTRDETTLEQAMWRYLPTFVPGDAWLMTRRRDSWRLVFQKEDADLVRHVELLEELATKTLVASGGAPTPYRAGADVCFPLVAAGAVVGVLGVQGVETLSPLERESLEMATKLIAIAAKNAQLFREITEEGVRDSLTGCFNRRYAMDRLAGELRRASRGGRTFSVLMLDLDQFKAVNEEYGHPGGDRVLMRVGSQLVTMLRSTDIPCRYGGDEFLVILPETPHAAAEHVAASVRREIAGLSFGPGNDIPGITVSVGVGSSSPEDLDGQTIIARADEALFADKRARRRQQLDRRAG